MKKFNLFIKVGITSFVLVKIYNLVQMFKAECQYQNENNKREYIKIPLNK